MTFKLILFPYPNLPPDHPVFTSHTFVLCYLTFLANISAYKVGWRGKKASPKQAEKAGTGSVIPNSVPATLAVYPEIKWYIAYSGVSFETGGKTPKASQVKNNIFLAWPP